MVSEKKRRKRNKQEQVGEKHVGVWMGGARDS